ncbi:MAG: two-component system, NarL family, response regulator NreC [Gaiellales bacterium]|jgi:DNA-binding NarL/FixJ family response regulator|nr:two-component system, NarL family, response regulator NreC [Gaiellales bacterium]
MKPITILLADDHALVRAGIRLLLDAEPDMLVVAEAVDGEQAVAEVMRLHPDIALLDVTMPRMNGLDAALRISRETDSAILMLSMQDDPGYVRRSLDSGASGYVLKDVAHLQLVTAVRTVAGGGRHIDPNLEARLAAADAANADRHRTDLLSKREESVFSLLALGHTNREIAEHLSISVRTAETQRANIMQKLRVKSRAELVRYALATGRMQLPA